MLYIMKKERLLDEAHNKALEVLHHCVTPRGFRASGLSAGRVQSAALRLIVEREREIKAFNPEEYWTVEAEFKKPKDKIVFPGKLSKIDNV